MKGRGRQQEARPDRSLRWAGCSGSPRCEVFLLDHLQASRRRRFEGSSLWISTALLKKARSEVPCLKELSCSLSLFSELTGYDKKLKWEESEAEKRFIHSICHAYPPHPPKKNLREDIGRAAWSCWKPFSTLFHVMTFGECLSSQSSSAWAISCPWRIHTAMLILWFSEMHWGGSFQGSLNLLGHPIQRRWQVNLVLIFCWDPP